MTSAGDGVREDADAIQLPDRYHAPWQAPFLDAITERLAPGCAVLDVGAGRNPTIAAADRPSGTTYAGLDISADELEAAGPGAYDETYAADASSLQDGLIGRFDLVVSWQVLEHVQDLGAAMVCTKAYLRPGGRFVAMFSGSYSAFALLNRLLPASVGVPIVTRVMRRTTRSPVFPAYYDRCAPRPLRSMLEDWEDVRIEPFFNGARYFSFATPLMRAYVAYEDALIARGNKTLATHFLLVADR